LWKVKDQLIEECDLGVVEERGINLGHEILQELTDTSVDKMSESGEDCAFRRGEPSIRWIREGLRGMESEKKRLESGHRSQACDQCLGCNVSGIGYIPKVDTDKVRGGYK
jgi:hypothetical protein